MNFIYKTTANFLVIFVIFFAQNHLLSANTVPIRNLSLGDTGEDVRALQILLNKDSRTRLADFGPGSPGEETAYFGPLTNMAVIKFQNLYAGAVLHPLGLSRGTGYYGPSTRAKLSRILAAEPQIEPISVEPVPDLISEEPQFEGFAGLEELDEIPDNVPVIDHIEEASQFLADLEEVFVLTIEPAVLGPGESAILRATGLSGDKNYIFIDGEPIEANYIDEITLSFMLPSNIDTGMKEVALQSDGVRAVNQGLIEILE